MFALLTATLERFDKKAAVLVTEDGQELRVSKEELWQPEPGQRYTVRVMPEDDANLEQNELAVAILNRLLNPHEQPAPKKIDA